MAGWLQMWWLPFVVFTIDYIDNKLVLQIITS